MLRKELRRKLDVLGPTERTRRSQSILERLFSHPRFVQAKTLLSYVARAPEVETWPIVERALEERKKVYLPRVNPESRQIWIIEISGQEKLEPGSYGILEPPFDKSRVGDPKDLDFVVVPGLGFDPQGGRLGRGGGYFDRFLKEAKKAYKIGLSFECQVVEAVPRGIHDIEVDEVLIG